MLEVFITAPIDPPMDLGLRIFVESMGAFGAAVAKFLGVQDIITGDEVFDNRFVIKGNKVKEVRELLTPEVRRALLDHYKIVKGGKLLDTGVHYRQDAVMMSIEGVRKILEAQVKLVSVVKPAWAAVLAKRSE